ncbi:hypothetical protein CPLU01_04658 [Colletotrichum plurivorum]|uniref:Uncharacterized protein n=1 Tax=Colletotrichum plurivorum TaxID=2175906 RepID=A0A8H6KPL4_9PEZI|nr:hypothetical protein CPLU01_04658 [Colletotrichum plurivorum]
MILSERAYRTQFRAPRLEFKWRWWWWRGRRLVLAKARRVGGCSQMPARVSREWRTADADPSLFLARARARVAQWVQPRSSWCRWVLSAVIVALDSGLVAAVAWRSPRVSEGAAVAISQAEPGCRESMASNVDVVFQAASDRQAPAEQPASLHCSAPWGAVGKVGCALPRMTESMIDEDFGEDMNEMPEILHRRPVLRSSSAVEIRPLFRDKTPVPSVTRTYPENLEGTFLRYPDARLSLRSTCSGMAFTSANELFFAVKGGQMSVIKAQTCRLHISVTEEVDDQPDRRADLGLAISCLMGCDIWSRLGIKLCRDASDPLGRQDASLDIEHPATTSYPAFPPCSPVVMLQYIVCSILFHPAAVRPDPGTTKADSLAAGDDFDPPGLGLQSSMESDEDFEDFLGD